MEDTIYATLSLSLDEVDVVLNALEEKAINVKKLRQNIFDNVNAQVTLMKQQEEANKLKNENKTGTKKGNKK